MAFLCTNSQFFNLLSGSLYKGKMKIICAPGLNCWSCPAAALACPLGALQVAGSPAGRISLYAGGFLLLTGLLLGRAVCGWLCPFGLLQELLHRLPFPKRTLWRPLGNLRYLLLAFFVLLLPALTAELYGVATPAFCKYICPAGTLEAGLPLLAAHDSFRGLAGALFGWKAAVLTVVVVLCLSIHRFFCQALCPLGAIYGLLNRLSFYRLTISQECTDCGKCAAVCPVSLDPRREGNSSACLRCGKCSDHCPAGAIRIGFKT